MPKEQWEEPAWIDETKAAAARQQMAEDKVIYGDSKVYRCVRQSSECSFLFIPVLGLFHRVKNRGILQADFGNAQSHVPLRERLLLPARIAATVQVLLATRVRLPFRPLPFHAVELIPLSPHRALLPLFSPNVQYCESPSLQNTRRSAADLLLANFLFVTAHSLRP